MDAIPQFVRHQLPLAEATLRVFHYALDPDVLDALYDRHRGSCYSRDLSFPALAGLLLDALTVHHGSGHAAFSQAQREQRLPVAEGNVYAKLGRVPLAVSKALLREGSRRLHEVLPPQTAAPSWPASLAEFDPMAIDGKKVKNAAKRLLQLRPLPGKLLAAKLLAAVSLRTSLVVAFEADPDGERNDVPLVDGLLPQVRDSATEPILWIADCQFADLNVPSKLAGERDHFLLRMTKKMGFTADPEHPDRRGVDAAGRAYREQWGRIGRASDKRCRAVRRIELAAATDAGDDLVVITDLIDADRYPATDLLEAYRQRWSIERVFQQVTEVFHLQTLIGCKPEGAVLQAALCFVLYNGIQVLRTHLAVANAVPSAEVSSELLFRDIIKELTCWDYLIDRATTRIVVEDRWTADRLREWLSTQLLGCWMEAWRKAKPKKKPRTVRKPPKTPPGHGGHTSVYRALQAAQRS